MSPDNAPFPQHGAIQDYAIGANPDIIFDENSTSAWLKALLDDFDIAGFKFMVDCGKGAIGCYQHIFADRYAVSRVHHHSRVNETVSPNPYVASSPRGFDLDEGVYDYSILNDNARPSG
jgi:hypothetical protein